MEASQVKNLLSAIDAAGITTYGIIDDMGGKYYQSDNSIVKPDYTNNQFVAFRNSQYAGSHNTFKKHIQVVATNFTDIHNFTFAGDYDQIESFAEKLGVSLSSDDIKILLDIDKKNYDIIPETGDYNRFKPLTQKQYDALTPEQKEEYDKAKAAEEKRKHDYIGQNAAASITL